MLRYFGFTILFFFLIYSVFGSLFVKSVLLHLRLALGRSLHGITKLYIRVLLLHFGVNLLDEGSK